MKIVDSGNQKGEKKSPYIQLQDKPVYQMLLFTLIVYLSVPEETEVSDHHHLTI